MKRLRAKRLIHFFGLTRTDSISCFWDQRQKGENQKQKITVKEKIIYRMKTGVVFEKTATKMITLCCFWVKSNVNLQILTMTDGF